MIATRKPGGSKRVSKHPKYVLKVKVEGPGVRRKSITIPDLLKICDAVQAAVHRQAEAAERPASQTLRPGPITASAHEECTLELFGLTGGSTGLLFRLAKSQQPLPMPGSTTFGIEVVKTIAETVKELGHKKKAGRIAETDPGVLNSLKQLGDVLDKKTISHISLTVPRQNGTPQIKAAFTRTVREHIAERIKTPTERQLSIEGKLEMADFKELGKVCRVHPPVGLSLQCTFDPDKEELVYAALRRPVRLSGVAKIDPNTGKPDELRIQDIEILDELLLGAKDFFASPSLEQLAQAQGVKPLTNPSCLIGGWPEEEDVDQFLRETYQSRS